MKLWKWFEKNEVLITKIVERGNEEEKKRLAEHLDTFVLDLGRFSWEIFGEKGHYNFVISPNRNSELLQETKRIVSFAHKSERWNFLYAKPSNKDLLPFELYDEAINLIQFRPKEWYVSNLEQKTIRIYAKEFEGIDIDTALFAAEQALCSFLGERFFIQNQIKIALSIDKKSDLKPMVDW